VEVDTDRIDGIGISIDFKKLREITESALEPLDHQHINSVPPFDQINPTAENLSQYLYREIRRRLPPDVRMVQVIVWESDHYAVGYTEP